MVVLQEDQIKFVHHVHFHGVERREIWQVGSENGRLMLRHDVLMTSSRILQLVL